VRSLGLEHNASHNAVDDEVFEPSRRVLLQVPAPPSPDEAARRTHATFGPPVSSNPPPKLSLADYDEDYDAIAKGLEPEVVWAAHPQVPPPCADCLHTMQFPMPLRFLRHRSTMRDPLLSQPKLAPALPDTISGEPRVDAPARFGSTAAVVDVAADIRPKTAACLCSTLLPGSRGSIRAMEGSAAIKQIF
jgi:hypothetical protein